MEWTGIAKMDPEFIETKESKLVKRWQLSVSHDRKKAEMSFMTQDGKWHTLFFSTDEQAVMTLTDRKKKS